ncbi:predicted protein [Plenodomus lingam JN3]|uniref:Predicted protein n=1 Tax=Leptosphaeria maculans (strain JN3 / isolate v23.1.3 / race Av1-4-5-6-7-8) TaxID=985895 RepID=E5ABT7_LEPMJ|nr:predicted protein [Plenodomus lingam JN3]CBY01128.1 predicted protein [Plenodomus lingam JN3]
MEGAGWRLRRKLEAGIEPATGRTTHHKPPSFRPTSSVPSSNTVYLLLSQATRPLQCTMTGRDREAGTLMGGHVQTRMHSDHPRSSQPTPGIFPMRKQYTQATRQDEHGKSPAFKPSTPEQADTLRQHGTDWRAPLLTASCVSRPSSIRRLLHETRQLKQERAHQLLRKATTSTLSHLAISLFGRQSMPIYYPSNGIDTAIMMRRHQIRLLIWSCTFDEGDDTLAGRDCKTISCSNESCGTYSNIPGHHDQTKYALVPDRTENGSLPILACPYPCKSVGTVLPETAEGLCVVSR